MAALLDTTRNAFAALSITQVPSAAQNDIVLYSGKGAHPDCIRATKIALSSLLQTTVVLGNEAYFQREDWIQKTKLVVIPGGLSTSQIMYSLGSQGLTNIRKALYEHKAAYLGLSAGAFLASRIQKFYGEDLPALFSNEAPIVFRGAAATPVDQGQALCKTVRNVALSVGSTTVTGPLYYNFGPTFENAEKQPHTTILARYVTSPTSLPPAIIHVRNHTLNAVLSGVHPEFPEPGASPEPEDADLRREFSETSFKVMLQALGFLGVGAFTPAIHLLIHSYVCDFFTPVEEQNAYLNQLNPLQKAETIALQEHYDAQSLATLPREIPFTEKQIVLYGGDGAHPHCIQATQAAL